jgi:deoxyribodipyrimidine photo-lyase
MRELWQTGFMHNRVRMIVGSFLVKNLLLHWQQGEAWFWDCLVDADLASNSASWQWIAGCGADAAPYFRIFNPVTQGEKFDKEGEYTRRYVPELKELPDKYLFKPWEAPEAVLEQAGIKLGESYPMPIVDLRESREQALEAFKTLKAIQ